MAMSFLALNVLRTGTWKAGRILPVSISSQREVYPSHFNSPLLSSLLFGARRERHVRSRDRYGSKPQDWERSPRTSHGLDGTRSLAACLPAYSMSLVSGPFTATINRHSRSYCFLSTLGRVFIPVDRSSKHEREKKEKKENQIFTSTVELPGIASSTIGQCVARSIEK